MAQETLNTAPEFAQERNTMRYEYSVTRVTIQQSWTPNDWYEAQTYHIEDEYA